MMPRRIWIAALGVWPGLAQIWTGQGLLGFFLAGLCALSVNAFVVSRWIWTEAFPPGTSRFLLVLAAGTWLVSLSHAVWWVWLGHPERHRGLIEQLYRDALEDYLQGHWGEARRRLEELLTRHEDDADAWFQLASVYRRTDQIALARRALRQCRELTGGEKWRWEIEIALKRLDAESVRPKIAARVDRTEAA